MYKGGASLFAIAGVLERKPSAIGSKLKSLGLLYSFNLERSYIITVDEAMLAALSKDKSPDGLAEAIPMPWSPEQIAELVSDYQEGLSAETLVEKYRAGYSTLLYRLEAADVFIDEEQVEFGPLTLMYRRDEEL
jgi:hypothetical protein